MKAKAKSKRKESDAGIEVCVLCGRTDEHETKSDHLRTCYIYREGSFDRGYFQPRSLGQDEKYTIRAWMAVVNYLLSDYRFLHE